VDIVFKNHKLQKEFNDKRALERARGTRQAGLIMQRLAELQAAENLEVMRSIPRARCHELRENRKGQISVDLNHPYRLIFEADHNPLPTRAEGGLDWKQVTQIKILGVDDTHE
jgi:plasmid maintenance system killer protein